MIVWVSRGSHQGVGTL